MKMGSMNDTALIALVRQNEELFNTRHPEYLNQQRRDYIWDEIGKEQNDTGVSVKERWTRLRENFRKALILRKTKLKNNKGDKEIKPPRYYKELSFLIPHLGDEEKGKYRSKLNLLEDLEVTPEFIMQSPNDESQYNDISMTSANPNVIITRYAGNRKRRMSTSLCSDDQQLALTAVAHDNDVLVEFFITMAKTVKTFPERKQLEIKAKLFQIVHKTEMQLLNDSCARDGMEDQIKIEPE